jgi:hypothetical protein
MKGAIFFEAKATKHWVQEGVEARRTVRLETQRRRTSAPCHEEEEEEEEEVRQRCRERGAIGWLEVH